MSICQCKDKDSSQEGSAANYRNVVSIIINTPQTMDSRT